MEKWINRRWKDIKKRNNKRMKRWETRKKGNKKD